MTKAYIQTIVRGAYPQKKDGKPGYVVNYPNGYISWIPKDTFEAYNRPVLAWEGAIIQQYDAMGEDPSPEPKSSTNRPWKKEVVLSDEAKKSLDSIGDRLDRLETSS